MKSSKPLAGIHARELTPRADRRWRTSVQASPSCGRSQGGRRTEIGALARVTATGTGLRVLVFEELARVLPEVEQLHLRPACAASRRGPSRLPDPAHGRPITTNAPTTALYYTCAADRDGVDLDGRTADPDRHALPVFFTQVQMPSDVSTSWPSISTFRARPGVFPIRFTPLSGAVIFPSSTR